MNNPSRDFGHFFSVGSDVLHSKIDDTTGAVVLQIGDAHTGIAESDAAEMWCAPGIVSMPADPTDGKPSCQTIVLKFGDRDVVFALRDVRAAPIYGKLKPGETAVFATTGPARALFKANGAISLLTTSDGKIGGPTIGLTIGPDGFQLITQFGGLTIDSGGVTLTAGGGALTMSAEGLVKLLGQIVSVQGMGLASISGQVATCIGKVAAPTPGNPGPTSALIGVVGVAGIPSLGVFISPV